MSIVSEEILLDILDIASEETFGFLLLAAVQFLQWSKQKLNFEIICAITLDILPAGWKA